MNISLVQMNSVVGDIFGNKGKIQEHIIKAKKDKVELLVFPELALTGYPPEDLILKPDFIHANKKAMLELLAQTDGINVIFGFVDYDEYGNLYNAAAICQNMNLKIYHKKELPNYGVFDEKRYFKSGIFSAADYEGYAIGENKFMMSICEDIWIDKRWKTFPKGWIKYVINISASPYHVGKLKIRFDLLQRRSKETGTIICYCNMVGGQDEIVFDGGSMIVTNISNPNSCILAPQFKEYVLSSKNVYSAFNDKNRAQQLYEALVLGTRDYIKKNGFQHVILGLSGGIDSALVAKIAVDAIGKEYVHAISMPSKFNSEETKNDARELAKNLGIDFEEIPINELIAEYIAACKPNPFVHPSSNELAKENIQARIRGNILMFKSNSQGYLVLTTSNKSEAAVGYSTLYGDMAGGFAPIKDVLKTEVFELAKYVNLPKSIIERPPSAELKDNQKDQDSLPPYTELDAILKRLIEKNDTVDNLCLDFRPSTVRKVLGLVKKSEYKRRQSPPGIKVSPRGLGKDWRFPITNKWRDE